MGPVWMGLAVTVIVAGPSLHVVAARMSPLIRVGGGAVRPNSMTKALTPGDIRGDHGTVVWGGPGFFQEVIRMMWYSGGGMPW